MLVYGDRHELAEPATRARDIDRQLDTVERMAAGLERHARLVGALVEAGKLLQGIADADFAEARRDRRTPATDRLSLFLLRLADAVRRSWDSGFESIGPLPRLQPADDWPDSVELRVPEGFAFYAVYPEAFIDAARRLELQAPPRVIGIRSIGTSLAAVVASALGAAPAVTVRPFGDPYARAIAIDPALERELLEGEAHYVIVDEGPGQSGSSFGAVADWLEERGVPPDRIAVLPSHAGPPGPAASEKRRRWWDGVQREVADFGSGWPALIERWCNSWTGLLDEPPRDISGGAWRQLHYAREEDRPAAVPQWERRKFLVTAGGKRLLAKFAGLGRIGEEKLAIARTLHSEGLVPEPVALVHGFLGERWRDDATPLARDDPPLREIAHYVGTRAKLLPVPGGSGASIRELVEMARRNGSLELGDEFTRLVDRWADRAGEIERRILRVRTDNRLDRHEWLRGGSGELIKTDALDHSQGHDVIGCQDVAWDVAGAIAEFDLGQSERESFIASVEETTGRAIDRELLDFYQLAYLAFHLGQARLGAITCDRQERKRVERAGDRYAAGLRHLLEPHSRATRLQSLVG